MTTMNIFELASRNKLRFSTSRGDLTVEQLWDLPLQSKSQFDLDSIAKSVNNSLKSRTEESFVTLSHDPLKSQLELMLGILKHIIQAKQEEMKTRLDKASKDQERQRIAEIINRKQETALESESLEQLQARLKSLSDVNS